MSSKQVSLILRKKTLRSKAQLLECELCGRIESNEDAPGGIPDNDLVWRKSWTVGWSLVGGLSLIHI